MTNDSTKANLGEVAWRETEDRYRILFEKSRDAMMVLSPPSWNFVSANAATLEMFGVKDESTFTSLAPWSLSPATQPDGRPSAEKAREMLDIAMREGSHSFEWRHQNLDGREIPASVQLTRLTFAGQTLVQATVRDLTPTEGALAAMRDSETRLQLAVEATGIGTYCWDFETGQCDYSPEFLALYDLPPDGTLPLAEDFIPLVVIDEDRPVFRAASAAGNDPKGDGVMKADFRIRRPDGSIRWLMVWGRREFDDAPGTRHPAKAAGIIMDITERKRAEEQIALLKHSIDVHPEAAYWFDSNCKFIYANVAGHVTLGFEPGELTGKTVQDVNPSATTERMQAVWNKLRTEGDYWTESVHLRKDGSEFPVEILTSHVEFGGKEYACGFARDITERKAAEAETVRLTSRLQQAQKMESVGRLAGGVAHDFNNMLGVILGHCELALEKVDPAASLRDDLVDIQTAAQRSADLTQQLLAFARKQTIAPKVLNLNDTVAGMLKMVKRLIGEDVKLEWRPGENLWPIKMDPTQIDQILANLCVNARDAIADVGTITIATGAKTVGADAASLSMDAMPGEYVRLAVSDDGCGMDQHTMAHVFEPFFTTKEVGKGTGLGLATVYGIVKQNDGFIHLHSKLGQGTVITVYLPRYVGKDVQDRVNAAAGAMQPGQETILLVEDEAAFLDVTQRMLEKQGYKVLTASTPGQAIQLAREHAGTINLLITDVVMPEMNGRDLAKNILSIYPQTKRLFMSGYTADVIAHHGILDEGVFFIQKPFSSKTLAATVRGVLDAGQPEKG